MISKQIRTVLLVACATLFPLAVYADPKLIPNPYAGCRKDSGIQLECLSGGKPDRPRENPRRQSVWNQQTTRILLCWTQCPVQIALCQAAGKDYCPVRSRFT